MYTKTHEGKIINVFFYVDYFLYIGIMMFEDFKEPVKIEFDLTNLGIMKYLLGIKIQQHANGNFVGQQQYATKIIQ